MSNIEDFINEVWELFEPIETTDKALLFGIIKIGFDYNLVTKIGISHNANYFIEFNQFVEIERFNASFLPYKYQVFFLESSSDLIERLNTLYHTKHNAVFLRFLLSFNNLKLFHLF